MKISQLENITPLSVDMQAKILGGQKGWLRRLFKKRHPETEHPNDDHNSNNQNHDQNDDHGHHGGGHG